MKRNYLRYMAVAAAVAMASITSCGGSDDASRPDPSSENKPIDSQQQKDTSGAQSQDQPDPTMPAPPSGLPASMTLAQAKTPQDVLVAMGMGWNMGNQFDAHMNGMGGETAWGQPKCTAQTFQKVAAAGIKTVRVPITWSGNFGPAPGYEVKPELMDRIAEVVGYAKDAGLNVILNMHHDGAADNESAGPLYWLNIVKAASDDAAFAEITATIKAIWGQVAAKFKDEGEYLMFECFNEIHNGSWHKGTAKQYEVLNSWNQAVVDVVRAAGGANATRWIGVPVYNTNVDRANEGACFKMPSDPAARLMVSVHFYEPYEYTLQCKTSSWGHRSSKNSPVKDGEHEKNCRIQIKKMYDGFTSKGIPVYFGEIGCCNRGTKAENATRAYYLEYVAKCMHDFLIPAILWDNGVKDSRSDGTYSECHGYFDHGTGEWMNKYSKPMIDVLVKAMTDTSPDYTLQSVYDSAPAGF